MAFKAGQTAPGHEPSLGARTGSGEISPDHFPAFGKATSDKEEETLEPTLRGGLVLEESRFAEWTGTQVLANEFLRREKSNRFLGRRRNRQ